MTCPLHSSPDAALAGLMRGVRQLVSACPACGAADALLATYVPAHHGRPGRVLLMCKSAQCRPAAIGSALGLAERELFDDPAHPAIPETRRMSVGRAFLAPGECPACNPDWIDASVYRLFGGGRPRL